MFYEKNKLKDQKIKCDCGCKNTLYISHLDNDLIVIGSEPNARKTYLHFQGVVISRTKMFELLNTEKDK